jgi:serine/threonine protein kinase
MKTAFHSRVQAILEHAARQRPSQRAAYIARICGDNPQLRREVESLLPHFVDMQDFEPPPPRGTTLCMPGTRTMSVAQHEIADREVAPPVPEPTPPFELGVYHVDTVLGRGGMGVVYRAQARGTPSETVAIKCLRPGLVTTEDRRRFNVEHSILRHLRHPGIARILHVDIDRLPAALPGDALPEPTPYFVMEYVPGKSLMQHARQRRLSVRERLELLGKICAAVEHAHHRGIVHRDLKPENILVTPGGEPKVLDFGISHIVAYEATALPDGMFAGTPAYASPEQRSGRNRALTPRSDVYALGLIAHELLTGSLPKREQRKVRVSLGSMTIDSQSRIPPAHADVFRQELQRVLQTALRQVRGSDYATAGLLGDEIEELLEAFPVESGWSLLKHRVWNMFTPRERLQPGTTGQLLSAVTRKRIELTADAELHRSTVTRVPRDARRTGALRPASGSAARGRDADA